MEKQNGRNIYILYSCDEWFMPRSKKIVLTTTSKTDIIKQVKKMIIEGKVFCMQSHWRVKDQLREFNRQNELHGLQNAVDSCGYCAMEIFKNGVPN